MSLNFYDFEVYKKDWLVVIINPIERKETVIINDRMKLVDYYMNHKDQIWIGYNSKDYDKYIIKAILWEMNPYDVSRFIIIEDKPGWMYSKLLSDKTQLYNYDCQTDKGKSLKLLEAYMGSDIRETEVPFDLPRKLTDAEIERTVKYCRHDVEQTIEVFLKSKENFDSQLYLINTFNLPLSYLDKTQTQLSALILDCKKYKRLDEFDIQIVDTLRIEKYQSVIDWYNTHKNYLENLKMEIAGVPHVFGWGGLHGAPAKPIHRKGVIIHVDVNSFYPSIMIKHNFLTRNCKNKEEYKKIYDKRIALKKAGKKKEQEPYKLVLNKAYGASKDNYSTAYDPLMANNICVNGQLLLLDLIEHLEVVEGFELIQSNTDGLYIQIPDTDEAFDKVDEICWEWERRTGMNLKFDNVKEIIQKDVNNYIAIFENGTVERKGSYIKELNDLDNDLPIVNEALYQKFVNNIPVEKTINECDQLIKFQKVVRLQGGYQFAWHNEEELDGRVFRVFASVEWFDTYIAKCKGEGKTKEKFANTPEHCFVENGNINEMKIPSKLDRQYYIDLAKKRLADFGFSDENEQQLSLF